MNVLTGKGLKAEFFEKGKLSVRSKFWEVIHDSERGGCITSIRFFNGSNNNILLGPISSYFGSILDTLNDKATIKLAEGDNGIVVTVYGELVDSNNGKSSDVKYEYVYEYQEGHIKITRRFLFDKEIEGISEIGINCMDINPDLDKFAARPSHVRAERPYATHAAVWGEIDFNDKAVFEEKNIPMYMGVFKNGVEGIEFLPGRDLEEWTRQFVNDLDQGRFQIRGDSIPKIVRITVEPFNSKVLGSISEVRLSGEYIVSCYIGLPMIPEKVPRKYMHLSFNNHPWPSEEDIRRWSYSGVNVVRLHNDYHPSGNFWHDGSWPPYDEKDMAELKRVIETCHRYGIKIVPYFSLYEINPKSEAFADGYVKWRRTVDERGSLIETYPPDHHFGFGMCLSSGWKDFLKEYVKKVIKTLGFDGIYYDYCHYWFCNNRLHGKGDHSIIDDVIDFLEYTRKLVGEDGIMLLHQSGWFPCVLLMNYADAQIMFEDNSHWSRIPPLEEWPPNTMHITFMNVTHKIPCISYSAQEPEKACWDLCSKCSLFGAFPHAGLGPVEKPILALIEAFRAFDLSRFKFKDYTWEYVKTDDDAVKGAIYFRDDRLLVVLANVREMSVKHFKWTVDLKRIGWDPSKKYYISGSLGEPIHLLERNKLLIEGVDDSLDGFRFKVYAAVKYREDEMYVLNNTRSWNETFAEGKLTVETKGPNGQKAILKFYSPKKPNEIRINSRILDEEAWSWNKKTRIGSVSYEYESTDETVNIQILL
ncbi:MAG: glycoside hydrolase family 66 protein [Thermoproteota archaeon]